MKKYYNKALFYQSFYNGKWGILGGSILFFLIMYSSMNSYLNNLKYQISNLEGNSIYLDSSFFVITTFLIILLVYVMITGFNKRNNITFITSGPYTKEEVKKNEFLFLFFTLCLFTLVAAYAVMCVYIRNKELLPYIYNPWVNYIFIIAKIFVLGLAFIVYLSFMDMLFSNLIFTLIALVGFPIGIFVNLITLGQLYFYKVDQYNSLAFNIYNILRKIIDYIGDVISFITYDYTFYRSSRHILFIIIAYLLGSIFVYYLSKFINKKIIINNINKFFVFPLVGKITVFTGVFSLLLGGLYYIIVLGDFNWFLLKNELYISNLVYVLGITFILGLIIVVSIYLTQIILKKVNKYI
ncbi:hypothetical protein [Clostridium paraputrificum]|uniref:hypothetical protein n=2 Tax=Clostridium paraputrificum TaxID=29363 RepID=UPI0006C5A5D2|nr:hypothetical protein [Clostridium paraputrificum]MDY4722212.1 hypothetical protein [Clostridium paraputrificum]CUO66814.1 Uncharacterised protein [Clostridium paraputrificum]